MIIATQLTIFFGYILYIVYGHGVLKSISDSWYIMPPKRRWMFTVLFCYPLGVLQMLHDGWMNVVAGAFLVFVGAATDFKSDHAKIIHYTGAAGAIFFALIALASEWIILPLVLTMLSISSVHFLKIKNKIWWVEVAAFSSIIIGLIQKQLV
jgi:hypothetical protein